MAGDSQFGPAPDLGARARRARTPQPLRDPIALREAMKAALGGGEPGLGAGAVYRELLRPFLAAVGDVGGGGPLADDRRAVARSAAHAALAELSAVVPTSDEGLGRRCGVLVPAGVVGELDARALADALDAGGWSTRLVGLDREADVIRDEVLDTRVELLVVPVADAAQVLASQRALSLIRRLNAPPLIVGVAFAPEGAASPSVGADHVVGDSDALPALLRRRLGGDGGEGGGSGVPWGVRMHRDGAALVVAPFGLLDATTVGRLREIVETRRTLYPAILIDLRELDALSSSGVTALSAWSTETPWPPTVSALRDTRTTTALTAAGLSGTVPFAQPA